MTEAIRVPLLEHAGHRPALDRPASRRSRRAAPARARERPTTQGSTGMPPWRSGSMPWASHLAQSTRLLHRRAPIKPPSWRTAARPCAAHSSAGRIRSPRGGRRRERVEVTDDQVGIAASPRMSRGRAPAPPAAAPPLGPLPKRRRGGRREGAAAPAWGCDRHLEMAPQHPAWRWFGGPRRAAGSAPRAQRATVARRPGDRAMPSSPASLATMPLSRTSWRAMRSAPLCARTLAIRSSRRSPPSRML